MRRSSAARYLLVVLLTTGVASTAGAVTGDQETFYLGIDGFPRASLVSNPTGGELPNFDRGRDVEPGLFLERSGSGLDETDAARYQQWQGGVGERRIEGYPQVVLWAAAPRFNPELSAEFDAYLLDCNSTGERCSPLGEAEARLAAGSSDWTEVVIGFDPIDHHFTEGRRLAIRVVVPESSESDLMLAYGFPNYRSRLTIFREQPMTSVVVNEAAAPEIDAHDHSERVRRSTNATPGPVVSAPVSESPWSWLGTVAFSTITLLVLGAFLVRGLTRPGRHEARFVSRASDRPRPETVSAG